MSGTKGALAVRIAPSKDVPAKSRVCGAILVVILSVLARTKSLFSF